MDDAALDAAIAAVTAIDLTEYRTSWARYQKADRLCRDADTEIAKAASRHVDAMMRAVENVIGPHRIQWQPVRETVINHSGWTIAPCLSCEVWPGFAGDYKMQARTHIEASCTPRNAAELLQWARCLKATMDIIAATHATEPAGVQP